MTDDSAWAPRADTSAPASPALLSGYRDAVVVARGGDSVVYRAHQESVDRDVAIKVVELDDTPDNAAALARFRRELEITVRLGRQHPHIVTVLAVGTTTAGQPCLVMDYFEQGSLHDRIRSHGPLPTGEVIAAGSVVADALAFAHQQGVLHRDVKPQNVLVLPTSWVLADFGLARATDAGHSSSLDRFSYRHASPQILDGEKPTTADDIYSLGSTLFTMLDGRAPFAADDPDEDSALSYLRRARTETPRALERDDVPAGLVAVVARCLAKAPGDRWSSAAELRDALAALDADETRGWAPDAPSATAGTPDPDVALPPASPAPAVATPPPADEFVAPEPLAVSALAHLPAGATTTSAGTETEADAEATGRRPAPPPATSEPARRRWWPLAAVAAAALAIGVVVGVVRANDDDGTDTAGPSPTPTATGGNPVVAVPNVTGSPSGPSGSAVFDERLAPTIAATKRDGARVDVTWTLPARNTAPVVVFLDDGGGRRAIATVAAARRSVTLTDFPAGRHCVRLATVSTTASGDTVFGLSDRRCLTG